MSSYPRVAAIALGFQGIVNVISGTFGLLRPVDFQTTLSNTFGGDTPGPAVYTISLQLLGLGIFTTLAATRTDLLRQGLIGRFCVHMLTVYLFWGMGPNMRRAAMADLAFAIINAAAFPFA